MTSIVNEEGHKNPINETTGKPVVKIVKTENGDVEVRKLPMRDFAQLLGIIKNLPEKFRDLINSKDQKELAQMALIDWLPELFMTVGDSFDEIAEILALTTNKDADFFLDGDISDAINVTAAMLEINNYERIVDSIKKLLARKKSTPQIQQSSAKKK